MGKQIIELSINDIIPYEGAHNTDDAVRVVKESISKFGLNQPITVDKNHVIVSGNAVYRAAKELGIETIPCVIVDELSDEQVAQYRIADNKTSEFARWNEKKLKKELSYLESPLSLQFCFDESINDMLGFTPPPSFTPPTAEAKPKQEKKKPTAEELDRVFKNNLKEVEKGMDVKPANYLEYTCSKCGKKVAVKI